MSAWTDFRRTVRGKVPQYNLRDNVAAWWEKLPRWGRALVLFAAIAFFYLLPSLTIPFVDTPTPWASALFSPIVLYVLVAIGLNIVVGYAGLLDLGYVAFFAIGAYTIGVLTSAHGSLGFWAALPFAILAAMLAGLVLGTPTLRLRGDYLAIVTLGFGEIIRITANNTEWLGGPRGITNIPRPADIGPLHFEGLEREAVLLRRPDIHHPRDPHGAGPRAQPRRPGMDGHPGRRRRRRAHGRADVQVQALGVRDGCGDRRAFGDAVRELRRPSSRRTTSPSQFSILFLAAVVLGGAGNMPGVILGAVLVGYLPERFRGLGSSRVFLFGAALVLMMIFRPQGIFPSRRRAAELADPDLARPCCGDRGRHRARRRGTRRGQLAARELEGHHDG